MRIPLFIHIVLTEKCPLHCSQCYSCISTKELDWNAFCQRIDEVVEFGIPNVLLTGGDPVQYSKFLDAVNLITSKGIKCTFSTSGVGLTANFVHELNAANIHKIFISLNGSTKEINSLSRDGYDEAIGGLRVLSQIKHKFAVGINWVARSDNVADFSGMMQILSKYNLDEFVVLKNKKQRNGYLDSGLSQIQTSYLAQQIRTYNQTLGGIITIDPCYKELRELIKISSLNYETCASGKTFLDIMPDNSLTPCRHLGLNKSLFKMSDNSYYTIRDYWKSIDRSSFSSSNCFA